MDLDWQSLGVRKDDCFLIHALQSHVILSIVGDAVAFGTN